MSFHRRCTNYPPFPYPQWLLTALYIYIYIHTHTHTQTMFYWYQRHLFSCDPVQLIDWTSKMAATIPALAAEISAKTTSPLGPPSIRRWNENETKPYQTELHFQIGQRASLSAHEIRSNHQFPSQWLPSFIRQSSIIKQGIGAYECWWYPKNKIVSFLSARETIFKMAAPFVRKRSWHNSRA